MIKLITIPMSHYCEKARWGLERLSIPYQERAHLQFFHLGASYPLTRQTYVPILVDGKDVIVDSPKILQHLDQYAERDDQRLYPQDPELRRQVHEWERRLGEGLGVESRRWVYHAFRPHPKLALSIAGQTTPRWQRQAGRVAIRTLQRLIAKRLEVRQETVDRGLQSIDDLTAELESHLESSGSPYLVGDRFTAADLTLACMFAPLVMPTNYGIPLPQPETLPSNIADMVSRYRATALGTHVMHLFDTEKVAVT